MTTDAAQAMMLAAASLFDSFVWARLFPLLTLSLCVWLGYWMLAKEQRLNSDFRVVDFLRDDVSGKPSWKRLIGTACFVGHSWVLYMVVVYKAEELFNHVALYVGVWSGSVVVIEALRIMRGVPAAQVEKAT